MKPVDLASVAVGGEFGRRIERIIEANILAIDVDKVFLGEFCQRYDVDLGNNGRYVGLGKFIDAVVRLAYATADERLLAIKNSLIGKLRAVQEPDGYIGVFADRELRVRTLWDVHEGAYIIWAFVSDYRLFNERSSLDAARRLANCFLARFAAEPTLQIDKPPIDQPLEISSIGLDRALLALGEATGERKYVDFVVSSLKLPEYDPTIRCGTTTFANHAYGHLSHCLAQLDLYRQRPDPYLLRTSKKLIEFLRQGDGLLVTGSASLWECWHDTQCGLDNLSETCVGAYLARLMDAMLQIEGNSLYGDIMERDIYNALFAATAPDGSKSRYFTPFEGERPYDPMGYRHCCANNNKRFLADLAGWVYYRTDKGVVVNLYNESSLTLKVNSDVTLRIEQQTDYPSSGYVLLKVDPSREAVFELKLRVPRWCAQATVSVNGAMTASVSGGQFYGITRKWKAGDLIELKMPMEWRFIRGRKAQAGRAAIVYGPTIFSFNPENNAEISKRAGFEASQLKVHPAEISQPFRDDSTRPGGMACQINAWLPGAQPWSMVERVPIILSEYPDPGGRAIYFIVPGEGIERLVDDELM